MAIKNVDQNEGFIKELLCVVVVVVLVEGDILLLSLLDNTDTIRQYSHTLSFTPDHLEPKFVSSNGSSGR